MIYVLKSGHTINIDALGLRTILLNGIELAGDDASQKGIPLLNGNAWLAGTVLFNTPSPTLISSVINDEQPKSLRTTHQYGGSYNATVIYDYLITPDDDIHITATVFNNGITDYHVGFGSPFFRKPDWGAMLVASGPLHVSGLQGKKMEQMYPSQGIPLAATHIRGTTINGLPINCCIWSRNDSNEKFLTYGSGTLQIITFFGSSVPPGGSRTYKWAWRFGATDDLTELLGGYKAQVNQAWQGDCRPIVQFVHLSTSLVTPENPYGYHGGRRFNRADECQIYVDNLVPRMNQAHCQGILMWQPQGIHPRGGMYRADFNVFPSETIANLPILINGFNNAGLSIGLLARPSSLITSFNWLEDTYVSMSDDYLQIAHLVERVKWAKTQGFKGFYLDSFLSRCNQHNVLKAIRDTVGPTDGLYTEHSTALSLTMSGGYCESNYTNGQFVLPVGMKLLRILYPESHWICKFRGTLPPGGYTELFQWMLSNKLTPIVEDWHMSGNVANISTILADMVPKYIDEQNRWRITPVQPPPVIPVVNNATLNLNTKSVAIQWTKGSETGEVNYTPTTQPSGAELITEINPALEDKLLTRLITDGFIPLDSN